MTLLVKNWYVLDNFAGTSEEENLITFIEGIINNLEGKYGEIYLLRNEEVYKIYDFEKGRGFQPDFILFLKNKDDVPMYYQVFIEAKQEKYMTSDSEIWKGEFLKQITEKYGTVGCIPNIEKRNYYLIGLPFYNHSSDTAFKDPFKEKLL